MHALARRVELPDPFPPGLPLSQRVIFPVSPNESNGIEDARFVQFREDDDTACYYATYTAYNGRARSCRS